MNNGERILRATGEFTSLTWLIIILCYSFISRQVKRRSRPIMLTANFAATLCSHYENPTHGRYIKSKIHLKRAHKTFKFHQIFVGVYYILIFLGNILLYSILGEASQTLAVYHLDKISFITFSSFTNPSSCLPEVVKLLICLMIGMMD